MSSNTVKSSLSDCIQPTSVYLGDAGLTHSVGTVSLDPSAFYTYSGINDVGFKTCYDYERRKSEEEKMLETLIQAIPFDQLSTMIEDTVMLSELEPGASFDVKDFIRFIVKRRVCPEEFLLEYFEYLDPSIIKVQHSQLLLEKKYSALLLKLKVDKAG